MGQRRRRHKQRKASGLPKYILYILKGETHTKQSPKQLKRERKHSQKKSTRETITKKNQLSSLLILLYGSGRLGGRARVRNKNLVLCFAGVEAMKIKRRLSRIGSVLGRRLCLAGDMTSWCFAMATRTTSNFLVLDTGFLSLLHTRIHTPVDRRRTSESHGLQWEKTKTGQDHDYTELGKKGRRGECLPRPIRANDLTLAEIDDSRGPSRLTELSLPLYNPQILQQARDLLLFLQLFQLQPSTPRITTAQST